MDYYEVLGISRSATDGEIKKAYKKLAVRWHPDKHKPENKHEASEKFKKIGEAYETLSDPQSRQEYDGGFRAGGVPSGQQYHRQGSSRGQPGFSGGHQFSDRRAFDIFEQFFGSGGMFGDDDPFADPFFGGMGGGGFGGGGHHMGGFGGGRLGGMGGGGNHFQSMHQMMSGMFDDQHDDFFSSSAPNQLQQRRGGGTQMMSSSSNSNTMQEMGNGQYRKSTSVVPGRGGGGGGGQVVGRSVSTSTIIRNGKQFSKRKTTLTKSDGSREVIEEEFES